jgi:hypothetical protein
MTGREWVEDFARRLGLAAPDEETIEVLLGLAGTAAHQSERTAAPIACYLVGLAGVDPARAAGLAAEVSPN